MKNQTKQKYRQTGNLHPYFSSISNIIIAGVYYPGTSSTYAPPQEDLIQHLKEKVLYFYSKYADPLILLMGDFNDLVTKDILKACKLKQVVKVPTRKKAILDLIMMNKSNSMYKEPITLPSIRDSDHLSAIIRPLPGLGIMIVW